MKAVNVYQLSRCFALLIATLCSLAGAVYAQDFPVRPITLINPYPAGGATDVALRLIASELTNELGQTVLVDSKPGGAATISAGYVARSQADGYTILASGNQHAVSPFLLKSVPYNFLTSFKPIAIFTQSPFILVVRPGLEVENLQQLIALMKAKGGQLNYGSSGLGAPPHMGGLMLNKAVGANVTHVPYQGTAPAVTALLGGQIDYLFADSSIVQTVLAGKVRAVGVTTEKRMPQLPNVPAMNEIIPNFSFVAWIGLEAPSATPQPVIDKLNGAIQRVMRKQSLTQRITEASLVPYYVGSDEFSAFKISEFKKNEQLIKEGGIKSE